MKAQPIKIEMDPLSSSDEEELENDCGTDKLHRPETLTVLCPQTNSVIDVSYMIRNIYKNHNNMKKKRLYVLK
ncbi:unnamed protein product [Wuchereria bancrofti]|uniref:Uncharacterized protein n=1 Tax=Wuchereria bancrofti TaxID=6293 RepID=A0A3P7E852_WUCBA|nr:unnamed protein product [Wuchereria bancrofti]